MAAEESEPRPSAAALFDLDGTLVRTFIDFPALRREMRALAARRGVADAVADEDDILGIVAKAADALPPDDGRAARREAYALLESLEEEGCAHPEPIAGASALLAGLRASGVGVGIVTRNSRRVAARLLARMDLPHDVLSAREDTDEFKPHPAPVLLACARLGVSPARSAMVGDLWADVAAGRAAGVRFTVGIRWPDEHPSDRFARCPPDFEVTSLVDAGEILRRLLLVPTIPSEARRP